MSSPYRDASAVLRPCPRCGFGLTRRAIADAAVDECPSCGGVFVRKDLMPRFLDTLDLGREVLATFPAGPPATPSARLGGGPMYVKCPHCQIVMNRKLFATGARVVVDICREHGVWFDAAELRAVVAFAEGGGMERAARVDEERQARAVKQQEQAARIERERAVHAGQEDHSGRGLIDLLLSLFSR